MKERYFTAVLTNGTVMYFDKRCTSVNYSDPNYVVFKEDIDSMRSLVLAVIPHREIQYIKAHDK